MYCHNCGTEVPDDSLYCPLCGVRLSRPEKGRTGSEVAQNTCSDKKDSGKFPTLALLLSVLVPGLGHLYMRRAWRGAVFLILAVLMPLPLNVMVWLINIFDVYRLAKNR